MLLATLVMALMGTACDEGGPPVVEGDEATELFERSVETTRAVATFHGTLELEFDSGTATQTLVIDAGLDLEQESGEVTVGPSENPDLTTVILDGERVWFHIEDEQVSALLPEDTQFVEGTRTELEELNIVAPLNESFASLFYLKGAENVSSTGTETIDGQEVAVYEFDVDIEQAISETPDELREAVGSIMRATGDAELEASGEVAIDAEERVRRLDLEGNIVPNESPPPGAPAELHLSLSFDLSDFNEDVSFDPPDEDEVVNLDDVPELRDLIEQSANQP